MKKSAELCMVLFLTLGYLPTAYANARNGSMKLVSSAFLHNQSIPKKFTCDGQDISPELSWSGIPDNAKSVVLIVDDPDAPKKTWVHWIVFNIPPTIIKLDENIDIETIPGAKFGKNDFGKLTYGGPCPPQGTHRYFFKLYALDRMLDLPDGVTKNQVESAMCSHILAQVELIGLYNRE